MSVTRQACTLLQRVGAAPRARPRDRSWTVPARGRPLHGGQMKSQILVTALAAAVTLEIVGAQPQPPTPSSWSGIYSDARSERGRTLYAENCRECHGDSNGTPRAPAIMGPALTARWQKKPI